MILRHRTTCMHNTKASTAKGNLTDRVNSGLQTSDMYQGEFVDGFFHGWGTIVFKPTEIDTMVNFLEAFNENEVYTWKNGNCYVKMEKQ